MANATRPAVDRADERRSQPLIELVESVPSGAIADDPEIPNTDLVWRTMLGGANRSIAFGHFYVAEKPADEPSADRLEPVIAELVRAARRGVAVRFIIDATFLKRAPKSIDRLRDLGIPVKAFDTSSSLGGVHHAKYLVVDEEDVYVGSANFDWRSLEHIHELGLRVRSKPIAKTLLLAFDSDWAAASNEASPLREGHALAGSERIADASVQPLMSPRAHLPLGAKWDLDRIVSALDAARSEVRVQLLSYETRDRDGATFETLDTALRRAASRGVKVRLLLSNWQKSPHKVDAAKRLASVAGVDVRFVNVPEASTGFIPFARVIHAKYLVVDEASVWLGTSNWSGDYFLHGRNVGLFVESPRIAGKLRQIFDSLADGPLAEVVEPSRHYDPPRVAQ